MNTELLRRLQDNVSIQKIAESVGLDIIPTINYIRDEINTISTEDISTLLVEYVQYGNEFKYGYYIQCDIFETIFANMQSLENTQFELAYGMSVETVLPQTFEPLANYDALYKHNVVKVGGTYPSRKMSNSICGNFDLSPYYGTDTFSINPGKYTIETVKRMRDFDGNDYMSIKLKNSPVDLYYSTARLTPTLNALSKKYDIRIDTN